jgi:predicted transcriptional regulator
MARRKSRYPTELELEILKILWREGPLPVRLVRQSLALFRDLAHTSVMTMMGIMTEKGYLQRTRNGNSYIYEPNITQKETTGGMLGDIVDRVFQGSSMSAMVRLLEMDGIDETELAELRQLIQDKSRKFVSTG